MGIMLTLGVWMAALGIWLIHVGKRDRIMDTVSDGVFTLLGSAMVLVFYAVYR